MLRGGAVILFAGGVTAVVYFLLYYPSVLDFFFELQGEQWLSLQIFSIIVPGLVLYGAVSSQEPIYEILGRAGRLQQMTLCVAAVNFLLTVYFVPFAGVRGAAAATMLSMVFYFALFGRGLPREMKLPKWTMLIGCLGAYLILRALYYMDWSGVLTVWLVPVLLVMLFYMAGLFGVRRREERVASGASFGTGA